MSPLSWCCREEQLSQIVSHPGNELWRHVRGVRARQTAPDVGIKEVGQVSGWCRAHGCVTSEPHPRPSRTVAIRRALDKINNGGHVTSSGTPEPRRAQTHEFIKRSKGEVQSRHLRCPVNASRGCCAHSVDASFAARCRFFTAQQCSTASSISNSKHPSSLQHLPETHKPQPRIPPPPPPPPHHANPAADNAHLSL